MRKRSDILGVILAGGKSSRMGTEKALLLLEGIPLVQHVARTLASIFRDVAIIGGDRRKFDFLNLPMIPDVFEGSGPLGGIHAALSHSQPRSTFVLSCDTPFVPSQLVTYVLAHEQSAPTRIVSVDGVPQPLCGLYDPSCLSVMELDLRGGKNSVVKTLQEIAHSIIPVTPDLPFYTSHMLRNLNRPEDYHFLSAISNGPTHG